MAEGVNEENGRMRVWKTTEWMKRNSITEWKNDWKCEWRKWSNERMENHWISEKMIQWENEKASEWENVNKTEWVDEKCWMSEWKKWLNEKTIEWVTEKATE